LLNTSTLSIIKQKLPNVKHKQCKYTLIGNELKKTCTATPFKSWRTEVKILKTFLKHTKCDREAGVSFIKKHHTWKSWAMNTSVSKTN